MNITLYNTSDPPNKVNKTLKNSKQLTRVLFKEDGYLDITNPTLLIQISDAIVNYAMYNYCYIPDLGRYYYITSIRSRGTLVEMECKCDVLKSFKNDIIGSVQYVSRTENESISNRYLVDTALPISSKHIFTIQPFGNKAYDENCISVILETAGKGGNI